VNVRHFQKRDARAVGKLEDLRGLAMNKLSAELDRRRKFSIKVGVDAAAILLRASSTMTRSLEN
jgi:hypothetical protein